MNRIFIAVLVIGVVIAIAVGTQSLLPRVEETDRTAPGAVVAPRDSTYADSMRGDSVTRATSAVDAGTSADPASVESAASPPPTEAAQASAGVQASAAPQDRPARDVVRAEPTRAAQLPTASAVLERAAAAYADVRSMQADFAMVMTNPLLRRTTRSRGTLYQRRPDRIALRFSDPAGDVIVSDGRYFWIYYPSVNAKQVIRMPAAQGAAGGVDLQAQFVGDPTERFRATLHGTERVGEREAYVLTLEPRTQAGYTSLKVWLDTRDYLARRFEIVEESGAVRRFDLSDLQTNVALGDATFRFTPPADAQIVDRG